MKIMSFLFLYFCILNIIITYSITPPNILFILVDDLGFGNLGYHQKNNSEIKTPNIDYLVDNGLELDRHYVHYVCSPTRSSMQSGRLPVYVNTNNSNLLLNPYSGIPINYTCIASKIKESIYGYSTHAIGKWDAGSATFEQTPLGRGYDTFFGYLGHSNSYWNEQFSGNPCSKYGVDGIIDLWDNDMPGYDMNDKGYESFILADKLYNILDNETINQNPWFISYMPHLTHAPMQLPKEYLLEYNDDEHVCMDNIELHPLYPGYIGIYNCRSIYQSMITILDEIIGNITDKLKQNGLWDNTLIIFSGDNGGELELTCCAANNYPLKGGKFSPWEGGIRTASFVSGGYLPENRRGQKEDGIIHIADWYTTILSLLDVNSTDTRAINAGLPDVSGLNVWDLITGKSNISPRNEIPIDQHTLIQGNYKYIEGTIVQYSGWMEPIYPTSKSVERPLDTVFEDCLLGCLYNIKDDPSERNNIIKNNEEIRLRMQSRLYELRKGFYQNNEQGSNMCNDSVTIPCSCYIAKNKYNNFYGPYQTIN